MATRRKRHTCAYGVRPRDDFVPSVSQQMFKPVRLGLAPCSPSKGVRGKPGFYDHQGYARTDMTTLTHEAVSPSSDARGSMYGGDYIFPKLETQGKRKR